MPPAASSRRPRFAVIRSLTVQLSLTNRELVRNFVPSLSTKIGFHWNCVVPLMKVAIRSVPLRTAGALIRRKLLPDW